MSVIIFKPGLSITRSCCDDKRAKPRASSMHSEVSLQREEALHTLKPHPPAWRETPSFTSSARKKTSNTPNTIQSNTRGVEEFSFIIITTAAWLMQKLSAVGWVVCAALRVSTPRTEPGKEAQRQLKVSYTILHSYCLFSDLSPFHEAILCCVKPNLLLSVMSIQLTTGYHVVSSQLQHGIFFCVEST